MSRPGPATTLLFLGPTGIVNHGHGAGHVNDDGDRDRVDRRSVSAAAAAAASSLRHVPFPVDHRANTGQERDDDATLRAIFDSPSVWKAFSQPVAGARRVGLFRNAYLTEPAGFLAFAHASLGKAQRIVARVAGAATDDEYRAVVRDLDRLSDLLCRVIDLCDFVRATTPDARIQQAAAEAWAMTYQYMNQLNTTTVLNDQLGAAMANPAVAGGWSEEERTVAAMLKLDFTKSAVDLPQAARDRFVDLSQRISEVGTRFIDTMAPAQPYVDLPSADCRGLDPLVARRFARGDRLRLPAVSAESALALRTVPNPDARKAIFYASRTASGSSVRLLEKMLGLRAELAQLAGFESYAHMALRDRMMAKSPESVRRFLLALSRNNAPLVQREVADLLAAKRQHTLDADADAGSLVLQPWDREFYMNAVRQREASASKARSFPLTSYFSLGTVLQGLSRLFQRLYGLRLVPRETLPGETWHPEVRRLDVVSDTEGHVAVLYCDLFYRDDKSPNPAHFTVRCSREIGPAEIDEAASDAAGNHPYPVDGAFAAPRFASAEEAANDGMATSRTVEHMAANNSKVVVKQLPTIALVCDFSRSAPDRPALLTYGDVETLFHEMGHAVHSVLARTALQTVAGTRCATDLAELPSTLMEQFVADPSVLALFARHYETDEPVDYDLVAANLRRARRFAGLDDEGQIVLALLDQAYHGAAAGQPGFDSTAVFHALQKQQQVAVDPPGTCWQGFFGHLFGYGSTYYSYLFDRALAERVWRVVFGAGRDGGALRRENGEHLRDSLLRWGGSRDPWRCVSDALRDERVAQGDEEAMALVGSWGTSHKFKEM
ncbi:metallopeptidase mip1 [Niveomyces insectorum RCEF 264]|uniref:Mitochondrial intermediate peptidase n=1 Tax=Niveomyces insectorum RCEF 264 TaxID=1081102 RepID=A0A168AEN6_9HYPO|nr:metallopeptidase mip1 [Niveomyces insectorum RCEF 264]